MDEKDQELQELNLDDIIKEFGSMEPEVQPEPEEPDWQEKTRKFTVDAEPDEQTETEPEPEAPLDDSEQTEDEESPDLEQEEPVESEEEPEQEQEQEQEQGDAELTPLAEAMDDNWEPDDVQSMGEYIPPQPIIFHPRSRLRELKRKLIAGPEKRYYELSEQGVGKLQAAIFLSLVVVGLSAGATILHSFGMVAENRMRLLVFGQFFAMLLSALLGSYRLVDGIMDLFHGHFTMATMLVFTFLACCADGVMGLIELRVPCCAAFSLEMTMALWSEYQKRITELGQMDTMRKAVRLDSLVAEPDYFGGKPGILRGEGNVEDFMDNYNVISKPEKIQNAYALAAMIASLAAGVLAGVLHGVSLGIQVAAVSALASVPASAFVALTRPKSVLERRLHRLGTVLCGWQGVEGLCGKKAFPITSSDLFPSGSIKMNGVKFYGSRNTDEVVAYAAALISADGGGLTPLFNQLLESRSGPHYEVENFRTYDGGLGGEINGEPVVMGLLSLMKDMGVEVPEGTRVNQAVYIAIDGELSGLFAFTYEKTRVAAAGITTLCAYWSLKPVLVSNDFMLTGSFIRGKFGVNPKRIAFPEEAVRTELGQIKADREAIALALTTQEGLAPFAYAATGARALRTASMFGLAVHMLGGIVGLGMMVLLAVLGAGQILTPVNMFLYQLVWMVPGLLVTEWTRSV